MKILHLCNENHKKDTTNIKLQITNLLSFFLTIMSSIIKAKH